MAEIRANGVRQAGMALEAAAARGGVDAEEIVDRLLTSPAHVHLLATALDAAARATDGEILDALALGLANAAFDDARVSDETEMARALREIGPAHLRLIRAMFRSGPFTPTDDVPGPLRDLALRSGHTRDVVLADEPALTESWDALIATVVRLGLVEEVQPTLRDTAFNTGSLGPRGQQTLGPKQWRVTGFGARLYDRVRSQAPPGGHSEGRVPP